jgi:ribonuclease HI
MSKRINMSKKLKSNKPKTKKIIPKTKTKKIKDKNTKKSIVVFTDGSCAGNGKAGAIGGIGIHFPNKELKDISKVYRESYCTNQRTELYAILLTLRYIKKNLGLSNFDVKIKSDSSYSIDCITKWVQKWKKNGWKKMDGSDVANKEYIEIIDKYCKRYSIKFEHVTAHTDGMDPNSIGNRMADKLATSATKRAQDEMKRGKLNKSTATKKNNFNSKQNSAGQGIVVELIKSKHKSKH